MQAARTLHGGAKRWRTAARWIAGGAIAGGLAFVMLLVSASGVTVSALALTSLLLAVGLVAFAKRSERRRGRVILVLGVGTCLFAFVGFVAVRLSSKPSARAFRFVERGQRDVAPPWL